MMLFPIIVKSFVKGNLYLLMPSVIVHSYNNSAFTQGKKAAGEEDFVMK